MPIMEISCECGHKEELLVLSEQDRKEWENMWNGPVVPCPKCNMPLRKTIPLTGKGKVR